MPTSRITRLYEREWYESDDEVYNLGRDMLKAGMFIFDGSSEAENLLSYFEKPNHWNAEHTWWVTNDRTDDWAIWENAWRDRKDPDQEVNTT